MAELLSGTVTFLLTDVEASTALWEEAPQACGRRSLAMTHCSERRSSSTTATSSRPRATGSTLCSGLSTII